MNATIHNITLLIDGAADAEARAIAHAVLDAGYEAANLDFDVAWTITAERATDAGSQFDVTWSLDTDEDTEMLADEIMNAGYEAVRGSGDASISWVTL